MAELRRYGISKPGDPGEIEDPTRCAVETEAGHQCKRKRPKGRLLCIQHAHLQQQGHPLVIPS